MSQTLTTLAILVAKPDRRPALEQLLRALQVPTRAEPGCRQYDLHDDPEHADTLYMLEQWTDEAALASHFAAPHFEHFRQQSEGLIEQFELKRLRFLS
ncbi:antibiotic biosynthesis monooxygenase [Pseudomonas gingeri]|uniref:putative quinol monooxygenase n=1 Tax=Pseudomonas gingeri TaxID=117681 RepID=UPI0015A30660|nr:putative quinol monooxygenase [Pseudomonas gingeri]NVZ65073.1 antibiotic biosynthesis monooxygenase [Pseudomonas gingeri]NVZ77373.1 antibiotic biosynthesis monooxygenase [Pseudomonas gingeri]